MVSSAKSMYRNCGYGCNLVNDFLSYRFFPLFVRGFKTDATTHMLLKRAKRQKKFRTQAEKRKKMAGKFSMLHYDYSNCICIYVQHQCYIHQDA